MNPTQAEEHHSRERSLEALVVINQLCNRLETGWKQGQPPSLEALLADVPENERLDALARLIPLDMDYRELAGEAPSLADYRQRFPEVDLLGQVEQDDATEAWLVTAEEFLARLRRWQLLSPEELTAEELLTESVPRRVMRLLAAGVLTRFQANQLVRTQGQPLVFGEYVLLDQLGAGGMGTVYRARHRRLGREVALKTASAAIAPAQRARFERETRLAAALNHPQVVATLDAGEDHGTLYLVMELIDGRDLARVVREDGPLPLAQALDITRQAALGLGHAHGQGIIHRDVKPANLLLDGTGRVRVLDLGLARWQDGDPDGVTTSGMVLGTRNYLAPEQMLDPTTADERADVFGLGCTLHFLLTGGPPGATPLARVPASVAPLVSRMLAPTPSDRPVSMAAVVREIDRLSQPQRLWWPAVAGVALVLILAVLWLFWLVPVPVPVPPAPAVESYPLADPVGYQSRWAAHLKLPVIHRDEQGTTYALIPPAKMGSTTLPRAFYLATTETTTAQFRNFVASQPGMVTRAEQGAGWGLVGGEWVVKPGFTWQNLGDLMPQDDHPCMNTSGDEAKNYCRWRTDALHLYRLPTEAEWEHACRAGSLARWCFGDNETRLAQFAWYAGKGVTSPQQVGRLRANAFGLHDLHGNHGEWCRPAEPNARLWPARGGRFMDRAEGVTSSASRLVEPRSLEVGFRVLLEIAEK